jgi:hypothetical protein
MTFLPSEVFLPKATTLMAFANGIHLHSAAGLDFRGQLLTARSGLKGIRLLALQGSKSYSYGLMESRIGTTTKGFIQYRHNSNAKVGRSTLSGIRPFQTSPDQVHAKVTDKRRHVVPSMLLPSNNVRIVAGGRTTAGFSNGSDDHHGRIGE